MSQTTTVVKELSKATLRHGITYLGKLFVVKFVFD